MTISWRVNGPSIIGSLENSGKFFEASVTKEPDGYRSDIFFEGNFLTSQKFSNQKSAQSWVEDTIKEVSLTVYDPSSDTPYSKSQDLLGEASPKINPDTGFPWPFEDSRWDPTLTGEIWLRDYGPNKDSAPKVEGRSPIGTFGRYRGKYYFKPTQLGGFVTLGQDDLKNKGLIELPGGSLIVDSSPGSVSKSLKSSIRGGSSLDSSMARRLGT